jgi:hypothetical protein
MDLAGVSTDLSSSSVALDVNVGVLKSLQNLDQVVAAQLAASLGLGSAIDAYA